LVGCKQPAELARIFAFNPALTTALREIGNKSEIQDSNPNFSAKLNALSVYRGVRQKKYNSGFILRKTK
jgi:hypothetical protein